MRCLPLALLLLPACGFLLPDYKPGRPDLPSVQDISQDSLDALDTLDSNMDIPATDYSLGEFSEEPAVPWYCYADLDSISAPLREQSFQELDLLPSVNMLSVYHSHCGEPASFSGPELGFLLRPADYVELQIKLDAPGRGLAWLLKDGCYYQHVEGCWNPSVDQLPKLLLSPGSYLLMVEEPLELEETPAPMNLAVAMNPLKPLPSCAPDQVVLTSELSINEGGIRELELLSPPLLSDRLRTACAAGEDHFGGAQEWIVRVWNDLPGEPLQLSWALSGPAPGERSYLATFSDACAGSPEGTCRRFTGEGTGVELLLLPEQAVDLVIEGRLRLGTAPSPLRLWLSIW